VNASDRWVGILYTAEKNNYSKYLDQAEVVINSFELF